MSFSKQYGTESSTKVFTVKILKYLREIFCLPKYFIVNNFVAFLFIFASLYIRRHYGVNVMIKVNPVWTMFLQQKAKSYSKPVVVNFLVNFEIIKT